MEKFIEKMIYEVDGLEFELEDRLQKILERTVELARIHPDLHTQLVQGLGKDYVVFTTKKVSRQEAYEWISKKECTLETLRKMIKNANPEKRQELYEEYIELKQEFEKWYHDKENKSPFKFFQETMKLPNMEIHIRYNSPSIELELDGEMYYNLYSDEEVLAIFKNGIE